MTRWRKTDSPPADCSLSSDRPGAAYGGGMALHALSADDRSLLRLATLANMNWNEARFGPDDVEKTAEISHYFSAFPGERDFGLVDRTADQVRAVGWLVFLPEEDPGYGFVDADVPELSLTTFEEFRGRGIGTALLVELLRSARSRGLKAVSLSVEDGNGARRLYERCGFEVVGRNGGSDTMLLEFR